ncbi:DNA repair protein RecN [Bacteroidia bacterium]|nr:DNA repair protein RecN [Bacteroidia bacterium]
MIRRLTIENYALIDRLDLEPGAQLNIITGETGAGKSILLGALSLLLGGRADAGAIGDPERNCVVEGTFAVDGYGLEELFAQNDLDYQPESIIRRVITPQGKSRAYINDLPVQLTTLKEVVIRLVDIHSQHQSLAITDEGFRTEIVDSVAGHLPTIRQYRETFAALQATERELARLEEESRTAKRDEEYLRFQYEQLAAANLREGEMVDLEARQSELANANNIREMLGASMQALDGGPTSEPGREGALLLLHTVHQNLTRIAGVYPRSAEFAQRVHDLLVELKDIFGELGSEWERIDSDPAELEKLDGRLSAIYDLYQKHRVSSEQELISLRDDFDRRLSLIGNFDQVVEQTLARREALHGEAVGLAASISEGRRTAAAKVQQAVVAMLRRLGMNDAVLHVEVADAGKLGPRGADRVEFAFSANKNMPPQPVAKIASGGEISRLMLAIKALVAKTLQLPTIIFDEIDSGVSGAVADAMGEIISELSSSMQVINITHLPQVASKGDTHLLVCKDSSGPRTRTVIRTLTPDERIAEIARLLSGSAITDAALAQARLLLGR